MLLFCLLIILFLIYSVDWLVFLSEYFKDEFSHNQFEPHLWRPRSFVPQSGFQTFLQDSFVVCKKNKDCVNWKNDGF